MQDIENKKKFDSLFKKENKNIVIIDVFSNNCFPCQCLKPVFDNECKKYDDIECASLNIDKNKFTKNFRKKEKINEIPYLMMWKKKGNNFKYMGGKSGFSGGEKIRDLFNFIEKMEVK